MKKWDVIIIVALIIISLIPEGVMLITNINNKHNTLYVEVYSEGKLYKKLPLEKDSGKVSFTIDNELGENVIEINNDQVKIIDADCNDEICVRAGDISKSGESLICLPHDLVVRIIGEGKQETDEVSF